MGRTIEFDGEKCNNIRSVPFEMMELVRSEITNVKNSNLNRLLTCAEWQGNRICGNFNYIITPS